MPVSNSAERLAAALSDRYTIERELGAGGMATVYLAHDVKHDRKVAIKVLRPELAAVLGAERFVQEITTTASLQHPHILPLFDSGEADGFLYYVMPYIEGETLRDKLNREKQLGIEEAVKITTEVADALDYAHRHNVIHRDIKPENILLHDGRPMVADFGIALAVSAAAGGRMTETGLSLGTPHYMSPEQATAEKELTHRSDIYSLGAVLYEMLTGDPPHVGSTAQQIIMKIVTDEPRPVTELRKSVPLNVAAATAKALEKLPADRFERAAQLADALANSAFSLPAATRPSAVRGDVWHSPRTIILVGTLLLVAGVIGWLLGRSPLGIGDEVSAVGPSLLRFSIDLPEGYTLADPGPSVAISADGRMLVCAAEKNDTVRLFRHELAGLDFEVIPGTEGALAPFLSPDGEWVGFFADGKLKKVAITGGAPVPLVDVFGGGAGSWGPDDQIVIGPWSASPGLPRGLSGVPAGGGSARQMTRPRGYVSVEEYPEQSHLWPAHLPGSDDILYSGYFRSSRMHVALYGGSSDTARVLVEHGSQGRYVPTGHLVYASSGNLLAAPFNLEAREVAGLELPLVQGVWTGLRGAAHFDVSHTGRLVYAPGPVVPPERLVWVDRNGTPTPLPLREAPYAGPRVSPDGRTVVLNILDGDAKLWVFDVDRPVLRRLTEGNAVEYWPVWDPNSRLIGHNSNIHGDRLVLHVTPADGSASARQVSEYEGAQTAYSWRSDGRALAFQTYNDPETRGDLWVLSFDDSVARPFLQTPAVEFLPEFSPDGRWIAYISDASGRWEVYLRPYPGPGAVVPVSTGGGTEPIWSPQGGEIFFRDLSGRRVYAVTVEIVGSETRVGLPTVVFEGEFAGGGRFGRDYDVTPDGRRFLMIEEGTETPNPTRLIVVDGWFHELGRRVGSR